MNSFARVDTHWGYSEHFLVYRGTMQDVGYLSQRMENFENENIHPTQTQVQLLITCDWSTWQE